MRAPTFVAVLALTCAACAGPGTATDVSPPSAPSSSETAAPASASPTDSTRTVALGDEVTTPRGSTMTVHSVAASERTAAAPAGTQWTSADVTFCVTPTLKTESNLTNITREFALALDDGTLLQPEMESALATERFSDDAVVVRAGDCVRGPVVFAVPNGVRPAAVALVTPLGNIQWPVSP